MLGGALVSDATHVTDLSVDSTPLTHLLGTTLRRSGLAPSDVAYINAHGTGTKQNDAMETRGIRAAFGSAANDLCVSTIKANLGHLVNAAGVVELAITALALRDGFAPPTVNLTHPDPECDLDCVPLVGRRRQVRARGEDLDRLRRPSRRDRAATLVGRRRAVRAGAGGSGAAGGLGLATLARDQRLMRRRVVDR